MMDDTSFINNNDDKHDYLKLLRIMNTPFALEKKLIVWIILFINN